MKRALKHLALWLVWAVFCIALVAYIALGAPV